MIVIRMARTPSLNASIRPLLIADPSRRARLLAGSRRDLSNVATDRRCRL